MQDTRYKIQEVTISQLPPNPVKLDITRAYQASCASSLQGCYFGTTDRQIKTK